MSGRRRIPPPIAAALFATALLMERFRMSPTKQTLNRENVVYAGKKATIGPAPPAHCG
jgi:hypothetical protein